MKTAGDTKFIDSTTALRIASLTAESLSFNNSRNPSGFSLLKITAATAAWQDLFAAAHETAFIDNKCFTLETSELQS